ncbi:MAG: prephenate/arogenate dehydrogenase family protein [Rhodospirillaceae bacterium]|jgi:cyclohexadieny/prephenate dehydrogenase|nr:prephenate/arogenate dehydrogenase family protein [Rhodospirillaceae bacterium]MBT5458273.1 prephenate/arogenate dehydrogenase family protein [Rhodospirillaceae bacterium]
MTEKPLFNRIALIGVGLIGSSLARVIRRDGLAAHVVGCARSEATRQTVLDLKLADSVTDDPAKAASGADLVIICTPVGAYGAIAERIGPVLAPGAIVSDVGSVKRTVIDAIAPHLPDGVHLVPGHPIAGTENSGPDAGFDTLFENRWVILTPPEGTDQGAIDRVAALWRQTGSNIEIMDADHHDQVLAITSHVPHLIAYTIVGTATDLEDVLKSEVMKFAASGFRDFTRIAASDPVMWRDIFLNNRDAVLEMLGRLTEDLTGLQRAIRDGDGDKLQDIFTRTREIRRGVVDAGQHIPPRPPGWPESDSVDD